MSRSDLRGPTQLSGAREDVELTLELGWARQRSALHWPIGGMTSLVVLGVFLGNRQAAADRELLRIRKNRATARGAARHGTTWQGTIYHSTKWHGNAPHDAVRHCNAKHGATQYNSVDRTPYTIVHKTQVILNAQRKDFECLFCAQHGRISTGK